MSVIAFDPKKFGIVAATLKLKARDYAWAFKYPDGWDERGGMERIIDAWAFDLMRANHNTSERQYGEKSGFIQRLPQVAPCGLVELYKHLQSIAYNLVDNAGGETNFNGCAALLERVEKHVANEIIRALPEYEKAAWA
jgi:hypothetical protein